MKNERKDELEADRMALEKAFSFLSYPPVVEKYGGALAVKPNRKWGANISATEMQIITRAGYTLNTVSYDRRDGLFILCYKYHGEEATA